MPRILIALLQSLW